MATNSKSTKTRKILFGFLALTMAVSLILSLVMFSACGDDLSVSDPTYTYSNGSKDDSDSAFSNTNFALNVEESSTFPVSSSSGWSKTVDKSSLSSSINSGVVCVADENYKTLISTLYADSDFSDFIENKCDADKKAIETEIKNSKNDTNYSVTNEDYADYIIEKGYVKNPKTHDVDNLDNYVYMLNNYTTKANFGLGTAQKITSSSFTLEAEKIYKISVWVKTENITSHGDFGANIRLSNSFNGSTQSDFRIKNIIADDWTNYALYVKADGAYNCCVNLILGLGIGDNGNTAGYVEGTAFFDDIKVEVVDEIPAYVPSLLMEYGSDTPVDAITFDLDGVNSCAYDMSFAPSNVTPLDISSLISVKFTESNIVKSEKKITSNTIAGTSKEISSLYEASEDKIEFELENDAVTLEISSDSLFKLKPEEYAYISFDLDNNLKPFNNTDISVDVIDILKVKRPNDDVKVKRPAVAIFSETTETAKHCSILIQNNFSEKGGKTRSFAINFVIGPSDLGSVKYISELASGTVKISNLKFATDKTYTFERENYLDDSAATVNVEANGYESVVSYDITDTELPDHDLYTFFQGSVNATSSLYAGYNGDYSSSTNDTTFSIVPSPSDIGKIVSAPANPKGYIGIEANHMYINNKEGSIDEVNTRSGDGDANGNIAGLINTKYKDNYTLPDLETKIGTITDDVQTLMIYNNDGSSYGFIGEEKTIMSSTNASVSVTLRVADDTAKAYVYLVDTSKTVKNVMTFDSYTVNGKEFNGSDKQFCFIVTKDMMDADGWLTVNFFIAAGATEKDVRLEVWNGDRNGKTDTVESKGYVFIKDITITTNSAFSEAESVNATFNKSGNPLYDYGRTAFMGNNNELVSYTRQLSSIEKQFNEEYPDDAKSYQEKYIWAKNNKVIYAVFNSVDPVAYDPYESIEENAEEESGCAETDSSTFWFSFSSILLAAVLVLAIIALFIKTLRRKHKANASDAKSHYTVKSRISTSKEIKKQKAENNTIDEVDSPEISETTEESDKPEEEPIEEPAQDNSEEENPDNQNLDSYVYGDVVSDFNELETNEDKEDKETNEDKEETSDENNQQ